MIRRLTAITIAGLMAVVSAKTCCEVNEDNIRILEDTLQVIEAELTKMFRKNFN